MDSSRVAIATYKLLLVSAMKTTSESIPNLARNSSPLYRPHTAEARTLRTVSQISNYRQSGRSNRHFTALIDQQD